MERTMCVVPGLSAIDRNRFIQEFADTLWVHRAREIGSAAAVSQMANEVTNPQGSEGGENGKDKGKSFGAGGHHCVDGRSPLVKSP
jgi:hypothetical protein